MGGDRIENPGNSTGGGTGGAEFTAGDEEAIESEAIDPKRIELAKAAQKRLEGEDGALMRYLNRNRADLSVRSGDDAYNEYFEYSSTYLQEILLRSDYLEVMIWPNYDRGHIEEAKMTAKVYGIKDDEHLEIGDFLELDMDLDLFSDVMGVNIISQESLRKGREFVMKAKINELAEATGLKIIAEITPAPPAKYTFEVDPNA